MNGELLAYRRFWNLSPSSLTSYIGFGTHYWSRDLRKTGNGGYREYYSWFYLPVGVQYEYRVNSQWSIGADFSLRWNVGGSITAILADVYGTGTPEFHGTLGSAIGGRLRADVKYKFSELITLSASPYVDYRPIGEGSTVNVAIPGHGTQSLQEPASKTTVIGIVLAPHFIF
jgi:hypothetical protein